MGQTSKQRTDFNDIVVEAIHETIEGVLGRSVAELFWHHFQADKGVAQDEIPYRFDTLFASLKSTFGAVGDTLGGVIVRKSYIKAGIEPAPKFDDKLVEAVENLEHTLANRPTLATPKNLEVSKP